MYFWKRPWNIPYIIRGSLKNLPLVNGGHQTMQRNDWKSVCISKIRVHFQPANQICDLNPSSEKNKDSTLSFMFANVLNTSLYYLVKVHKPYNKSIKIMHGLITRQGISVHKATTLFQSVISTQRVYYALMRTHHEHACKRAYTKRTKTCESAY